MKTRWISDTQRWFLFLKTLGFAGLLMAANWHCNSVAARPDGAFFAQSFAEKTTPVDPQMAEALADYDRFFELAMTTYAVPGAAVVIVKDTSVIFCKGYGRRALGSMELVDEHTVFRIGSLSKGFAGVLTGILVAEKQLNWDDPVQRHFPEFKLRDAAQARRMQLTHLLSHTTGLPYQAFTSLIEQGMDLRKMAAWLPKAGIYGKEGTIFRYQNIAFSLIEEVMRGATGQTYEQLLTEKILRPAGMTDASLTFEGITQNPNHAEPTGRQRITPYYYNTAPAGGVNASASDMGQWLKVLLGHRPDIVADSTLDEVFRPRIRTEDERRYFGEWPSPKTASYALGWRVLACGGDTLVCHGGYVNGFKSEIAFDRRAGIGICVLFNAPSGLAGRCLPEFFSRLVR
ncbi:MAG: serine hydrolase domain-containing protein [Saprospiraceae bacterium]